MQPFISRGVGQFELIHYHFECATTYKVNATSHKVNDCTFTIVIPTFDRPAKLGSCLRALSKQSLPVEHFEVVVVDDGGTAELGSVIGEHGGRLNARLVRQPNAGPASARNHGAALAAGKFVAFTDDDCLPDVQWLELISRRLEEAPERLVGGRTINAVPDNNYSEASQHLISYLYTYYGGRDEFEDRQTDRPVFLASNNMAMRLDLFQKTGGFDTSFPLAAGEDREFCDRWGAHGLETLYAHEAVVYHLHDLSLASFARQHFAYGRGAYHFHRARRRRADQKFFIEPLSFYSGLIRHPLTLERSGRAWLQSGLLALAQVANASGYFWERVRGAESGDRGGH